MHKKIAVFCDGTWNQASVARTNVVKLFQATHHYDKETPPNPQIAHYLKGVGTKREEWIRGGAFGYGISDKIKEAYSFIVSNFEQGDKIYLFGFSRGAYTARSIGGLIRNVGILRREQMHLIDDAYEHYRNKTPGWAPDGPQAIAFRNTYSHPDKSIEFIGVWDTVGALGAPYGEVVGWFIDKVFKCSFHDDKLSSWVKSAYHALAADEKRWPFRPTRWTLNEGHLRSNEEAKRSGKIPNYEEKWFPGVHSDVGGGYPETGLSDIALEWMAFRANQHGLNIDLQILNNSEAGPDFKPDISAKPHESQTWYYQWLTKINLVWPSKIPILEKFLIPGKIRPLIDHIKSNGDYHRPIGASDDATTLEQKIALDPSYDAANLPNARRSPS